MEPLERFSRQKLKDWREKRKGGVVEKGHDLISLMRGFGIPSIQANDASRGEYVA